jgi:DNA-binding MarR family transcriptional regulator
VRQTGASSRLNALTGEYSGAPLTEPFLKGPIPMAWLKAAAELPGKAFQLGIAIWWLRPMSKSENFKLTQKALDYVGISRDATYDALKRLEARGLIRVQRSPGRRPIVGILTPVAGDAR